VVQVVLGHAAEDGLVVPARQVGDLGRRNQALALAKVEAVRGEALEQLLAPAEVLVGEVDAADGELTFKAVREPSLSPA